MSTRFEVVFRGRVQGVGFRATTERVARDHPAVTGWVRNEPDGSVRLVIEGTREDLEHFLSAHRDRLAQWINDERLTEAEPRGGYKGFEIRY